jgi:hypothetical protein
MIGELEAAAADWLKGLARRRHKHEIPIGQPCANCEVVLQGPYCHACGQNADSHKRSIFHLFWEALEGLFHFDGRLWRTMPLLFFRPGKLANDYIEGRMARHVPPFRTFLVSLLLFIFAAEHAIHRIREEAEAKTHAQALRLATPQGRAAEAARLRAEAIRDRDKDIREADDEHARELKSAEDDAERRSVETGYQAELKAAEKSYAAQMARAERIARGENPVGNQVLGASAEKRRELANQIRTEVDPDLGDKPAKDGHPAVRSKNWFKEGIAKAVENPDYYLTVMFGWAHRVAILLLPIVGLSLAMVYFYRRKYFLYDHLLVAMNLLSFAFLTNALGMVLPMSWWPFWTAVLVFWPPINLFQTLRGAYHSSVIGALLKTLVVWMTTVIAFSSLLAGLLVFTLSQV